MSTPKGSRGRIVPMTDALLVALQKHRHLRGERVLTLPDGGPVAGHVLRDWIERAQRRAGLPATGNAHILRHTFCSHLAMKGAPAETAHRVPGINERLRELGLNDVRIAQESVGRLESPWVLSYAPLGAESRPPDGHGGPAAHGLVGAPSWLMPVGGAWR